VHFSRPSAVALSLLTVAASAVAVIVLAALTGVSLARTFDHVNPAWLPVVAIATAASYLPYIAVYRLLTSLSGLRPPSLPTVIAVVLTGFGPFVVGGGFSLDRQVMMKVYDDRQTAHAQVVALIALEWVVLAPLVWLAAVIVLVSGAPGIGSMLWPWVIGVPAGLGLGLWLTAPGHDLSWLTRRPSLEGMLEGIRLLHRSVAQPARAVAALVGMSLYWVAEIAALYGAVRMFGPHVSLLRITVAYGTGYVVTRRSLPLAGAIFTEMVLTFSLHWLGAPLGPALLGVAVYRLVSLALICGPAILASRRVHPDLVA
jgi:uncharacterized membrane protein YbhN (UPF0104 family)